VSQTTVRAVHSNRQRRYEILGSLSGEDQTFPNCGARPPGGALVVRWGGRVDCMRDIFLLNHIQAQVKIHILLGTLLG
jgi:hypothetical protein